MINLVKDISKRLEHLERSNRYISSNVSYSSITTANSPYSVLNEVLVLADSTSGNITVNLPAASQSDGRIITVKKTDSSTNTVTVDASVTDLIDGSANYILTGKDDAVTIISDILGWYVTAEADIPNAAGAVIDHNDLLNIGTNTHGQIDNHIANTGNPHNVLATQITDLASLYLKLDGTNSPVTGSITFSNTMTTTGRKKAITTKTSNYTATSNDEVIKFTSDATLTLPSAMGTGQHYLVRAVGCIVTIDGNGADTINEELTQTLYAGDSIQIIDEETGIWGAY